MAYRHGRVSSADTQAPPIVRELEGIFEALPDEELLAKLKAPRRFGRPPHDAKVLWHCYVAMFYLGLPSVSDLIRSLYDNPCLAATCGIGSPDRIPSQPTFSRFGSKLAKPEFALAVKNVLRALTRRLFETYPDFGQSVAIDSTDIKAWSNGGKKGKPKKVGKRRMRRPPKPGRVSDPDAGWIVKSNTEGNKKYVWGYKVHILADTTYELPVAIAVSAGNVHDVMKAKAVLAEARETTGKFHPQYVIADAAYSADWLRRHIKRQYRAEPIIDPNPQHRKAFERERIPEWKGVYNRRTAVERLNARLKAHRRLNSLRVRGRFKVRIHALLATIVCQAQALATETRGCVRTVACPHAKRILHEPCQLGLANAAVVARQ